MELRQLRDRQRMLLGQLASTQQLIEQDSADGGAMLEEYKRQLEDIEDELAYLVLDIAQLEGRGIQTVRVPIPPSVNKLYATVGRRRVLAKDGRSWKKAAMEALSSLKPAWHYPVEVVITVRGGAGFNLRRDVANCEKIVVDTLVEAGVLAGDTVTKINRNTQEYLEPDDPSAQAFCEVTIIEAKPARCA